MFEWLAKHSGHIIKIEVNYYETMKTFLCHCLQCQEKAKFDYLR